MKKNISTCCFSLWREGQEHIYELKPLLLVLEIIYCNRKCKQKTKKKKKDK